VIAGQRALTPSTSLEGILTELRKNYIKIFSHEKILCSPEKTRHDGKPYAYLVGTGRSPEAQ